MFEYDVFISYSHIDNQVFGASQEGWISSLHQSLEVRLSQLLGREVRIWRDQKLQGNDFFADEIVDRFPNVATMVSILSPRYVKSEWCVREVEEFVRAGGGPQGLRVGNKARIFKLVKTQIAHASHPPVLQDLLGYDFFVLDPETKRARELNQTSGSETERKYWAKLDDLAHDLADLLEAMAEDPAPAAAGAPVVAGGQAAPVESDGATVYLAETSYDLREERDAIRRDLQQHGHQVLPQQPLSLLADELTHSIPEALAQCSMSIHLLGRNYGVVPEGATRSTVDLQNELAGRRSAEADLQRLIWIPPDLETEDERQSAFLDMIRTDSAAQVGADVLETPLSNLKSTVLQKLLPEPEPSNGAPRAAGDDELLHIYLVCDKRDVDDAVLVEDLLYDRGFEVTRTIFEGEESEIRLDHQENLKTASAVILYYGAAKELWLRAKLRELQKVAGYGRTEPMRAKAILVTDPPSPGKERLRTREAMILRSTAGDAATALEPFFDALGGQS